MARKNDGVELVITAKNETDKSFDDVKKSIDEFNAALAKKPAAGGLFDSVEKQIESLINRKKQADKLIGDVAALQKSTAKQKEYAEAIDRQSTSISKNQELLAQLKAEYIDIAKAASTARVPNERLTKSLVDLEAKKLSLGDQVASLRQQLDRETQALSENVGLDERATAAIAKQESKLLEVGKAWRLLTNEVSKANRSLIEIGNRRDTAVANQADGKARLDNLRTELELTKQINQEAQKAARSKTATDGDRSAAVASKARLDDLTTVYNNQRQVQAELTREVDKLNAAYRRQEQQASKLKDRAGQQKKIYDDLKKSVKEFSAAQRQEGSDRQLASITKITSALNDLETQYQDTNTKITAANAAITKASSVDPRALAARDAYEKKIREATAAVQKEQQELVELKTKMDAAGISTAALATRQKELDGVTERLVSEQQRLATQLEKVNAAAKPAAQSVASMGKSFLGMGNDTRTTLSYLQRIRGELLSIIATTTGLYAVGGGIKSIYDTSVLFSKAESRFSVFFKGDTEAIKQEVAFIRGLSNDLKIEFETALEEYSKFVSGLDPAQVPLDQIRGTFQGFAVAARVGRLSAEDFGGVMRALTQIFSKQKIQLEELQGQIGDRLPGAINRTAAALQIAPTALRELIEEGKLGAEGAILLANQLQQEYGANLPKALDAPDAALADFKNTITDLKKEIADSGFIQQLTVVLKELTKELKNPATRQGIVDLIKGVGQLGQAFVWLIQNAKEVGTAIALLFGGKVLLRVLAFSNQIRKGALAFQAWATAGALAGSRVAGVFQTLIFVAKRFFALLGAFSAGFALGTWANQFGIVRKAGYTLIAMLDLLIETVKAVSSVLSNPLNAVSAGKQLTDAAERIFDDVSDMYEIIDQKLDIAIEKPKQNIEELRAAMDAILESGKNVSNFASGFLSEEEAQRIRDGILNGSGDLDESVANKLKALEESIANSLNDIDQQIQEKSADTLQQRLDAINLEYTKLLKKIDEAVALGSKIDVKGAKDSIDQIVAIKQVEAIEKEINRLIEERKTATEEINKLSTTGAITVEEATKRVNAENARIIPQLDQAVAKAQEIASKIGSTPITQAVSGLDRTVDLEKQSAGLEQITTLQTRLNEQMSVYRDRVQTINALVQSGSISEADAKQQILELQNQTNAQASITIQKMRELILANKQFAESFEGQRLLESLKQTEIELQNVKVQILDATELNEQFASGLTGALEGFIRGTMSAKEAFRSFISDFLAQIAKAIAQALILKAITGSTGGGSGGLGGILTGLFSRNHTGGIVGQTASRVRAPITAFAGAVKYHGGGIAGLKSNEVPSILQKGEEVLTRNDPRHILNNGGLQQAAQFKIVNAFDRDTVAKEAFSSPEATKAVLNIIRTNKNQFKTVLS